MAGLPRVATVLALAAVACAATIRGSLRLPVGGAAWSEADAARVLGGLQVVLNGGQYATKTHRNGEFVFFNVPRGHTYSLEIEHREFAWSTFKLQVPAASDADDDVTAAEPSIAVLEYKYPGAPKLPTSHPLVAFPVAPALYFEERPKMSVWAFLRNPQILLFVVMGGLMLCMPYMQKGVESQAQTDPELAEQMRRQQEMMSNPMAALTSLLGGGGGAPEPQAAARPSASSQMRQRTGAAGGSSGGAGGRR